MSSIKKNKKKKTMDNIPNVSLYETVPDNIKILFGKFYFYSLVYIIFFGILYPWILMFHLNKLFSVIMFLILIILYILIIFDIKKKIGKYRSNVFYVFIILVIVAISFSVVKFII